MNPLLTLTIPERYTRETTKEGTVPTVLRILIQRSGSEDWRCQCLDYDLMAGGHTLRRAQKAMVKAVACRLQEAEENVERPFASLPRASDRLWYELAHAQHLIPSESWLRVLFTDSEMVLFEWWIV